MQSDTNTLVRFPRSDSINDGSVISQVILIFPVAHKDEKCVKLTTRRNSPPNISASHSLKAGAPAKR